jgi:hypothetical protein
LQTRTPVSHYNAIQELANSRYCQQARPKFSSTGFVSESLQQPYWDDEPVSWRLIVWVLQKVPAEQHEDAGAVADSVKETRNKVNQGNPNKKSLANSLNGLLSVAKDVAQALPVATKIATIVAGMFVIAL